MIDPNISLADVLKDGQAKLLLYGPPPVLTQDLLDKILKEEEE